MIGAEAGVICFTFWERALHVFFALRALLSKTNGLDA
jgi:hypothetical protein